MAKATVAAVDSNNDDRDNDEDDKGRSKESWGRIWDGKMKEEAAARRKELHGVTVMTFN